MKPVLGFKYFIAFILLLVVTSTFLFGSTAKAQSIPAVAGPQVPVSDAAAKLLLEMTNQGIGSAPGSLAGSVIDDVKSKALEACAETIKKARTVQGVNQLISDSVQKAGFWLSLIGGSGFEAKSLSLQIKTLEKELGCISLKIEALQNQRTVNLIQGQNIQREQAVFEQAAATIEEHLATLRARAMAGWKDVAKAFMVRTLLSLNKSLTTRVVNELVNKYKIDDYLAYGDAVATQIYAMKYIDQNFEGDARTQMMMRSLIQSEKVPQQARVAVQFANQQAKQYMGNACSGAGQLDAQNPASLRCLSSMGQVEASPTFRYLKAVDMAGQVKGEAVKTAQAEMAAGNGYAPPRDCGGSISQQQQLDAKIQAAASEADAAEAVLARLEEALKSGQTTQAEVDKAAAAFDAADEKLAILPIEVNEPVIDICKAIDSPGAFIGNSIQKMLDQHLEQGSQLKSDNLPAYMTFLSDMTSNFLTNLLTGGKSSSKVFKEAGFQVIGDGVGYLTTPRTEIPDEFPDDSSNSPAGAISVPTGTNSEGSTEFNPSGDVRGASAIYFDPRGSIVADFRPR